MNQPLISVIIPTYNRLEILSLTLQGYEEQKVDFEFELIVVDDGSSDNTWDFLSNYESSKFLFSCYHQSNQGPAQARNLAIDKSKGTYLVITGDDIIPSQDFLAKHYQSHQNADSSIIAVLGKTIWHPDLSINSVMKHIDGKGAQQFSYYYLKDHSKLDFRHFYTSNISFLKSKLNPLDKLFDTDFTCAAYEDIELAYRLLKKELKILYRNDIIAYHHHEYMFKDFTKRQYNAGRMACIFREKHEEIADMIGFAHLKTAQSIIKQYNLPNESIEIWENFILDFFETYIDTQNKQWLDHIYIGVFQYFYMKGLIIGNYKDKEEKIAYFLWYFLIQNISNPLKEFNHIEKENIKNHPQYGKILRLIEICDNSQPKIYTSSRYYDIFKKVKFKIKSKLEQVKSRFI